MGERGVVCAPFRRAQGEVSGLVTGDADYSIGADQTTRGLIVGILLADMDAVGTGFGRDVDRLTRQSAANFRAVGERIHAQEVAEGILVAHADSRRQVSTGPQQRNEQRLHFAH